MAWRSRDTLPLKQERADELLLALAALLLRGGERVRGWSSERILGHYYPGTSLQPLAEIGADLRDGS